jgi:hypothetical protein
MSTTTSNSVLPTVVGLSVGLVLSTGLYAPLNPSQTLVTSINSPVAGIASATNSNEAQAQINFHKEFIFLTASISSIEHDPLPRHIDKPYIEYRG